MIAIDRVPVRLRMAEEAGAVCLNYEECDIYDTLLDMTQGEGPDHCIDAVGMEGHGRSIDALLDSAKAVFRIQPDRIHSLRQAIHCCRKAGTVSVPGVYIGVVDKFNFGRAFNKGLKLRMGQTHTHRYMRPLLDRILNGDIDPSFVISHRLTLDEAPEGYRMFRDKAQDCTKVVMNLA